MGARDFSEDGHVSTNACESVWEICMQIVYVYVELQYPPVAF